MIIVVKPGTLTENAESEEQVIEIAKLIEKLLKRGMPSTIEKFLMSAEFIISDGNENVILCERV